MIPSDLQVVELKQLSIDNNVGFGTSGVRARVEDLTPIVCACYAAAFIQELGLFSYSRVALGMDLRPSSPLIAQACAYAIKHAGLTVDFCGVLPTPALAYYAMQEGIPSIMVTGSHIPFDRNGIKFFRHDGEITKNDEEAISAAVVALPNIISLIDLPAINHHALQLYMERYQNFFKPDILKGVRIGVYQHSGVARDTLVDLMQSMGGDVVAFGRTDDFVPIDTEAVSDEDCERGRQWSKMYQLDAIVSTDGDADRPLIGDESGEWLRGDVVGLLCAKYLNADSVVTPVSSTSSIESSRFFSDVIRTKIGSPFVVAGMERLTQNGVGTVVGFEANGGFLLGSRVVGDKAVLESLPTRDAVLPILALLSMSNEKGIPMSALSSELPQRYTASDRLREFSADRSGAVLNAIVKNPELLQSRYGKIINLNDTDGKRITFQNGEIIHLRPSGNAPELRCYAEADNATRAKLLVSEVLSMVSKEW